MADSIHDANAALEKGRSNSIEAANAALPRAPSFSSLTEQAGAGIYGAATSLVGAPGDIGRAVVGTGGGYPFPEFSPSTIIGPALNALPGQKQIETFLEPMTGPKPAPHNLPEQWSRTLGEFFPLGFGGGTLRQSLGRVLMPTIGAETARAGAKQMGLSESGQESAKFYGSITPGTLTALWRTAPDRMEAAASQLKDFARKNYQHDDVKGLKIKVPVAQSQAFTLINDLSAKFGMRGGPVADAINELAFPPTVMKKPYTAEAAEARRLVESGVGTGEALEQVKQIGKGYVDYDDISSIRNRLSAIMMDFNHPHDQLLARRAKLQIDDWMTKLGQNDLVAGNAAKATARLADARSDWWAAESLNELGSELYRGERTAAAAYSGQNLENRIRQRITAILTREKDHPTGQFTPKEIKLLERASGPEGIEQLARRVARLFPRHGAAAPVVGAALGYATGHSFEGALAGAAAGELASVLENKIANGVVRDVQREILNRAASGGEVRLSGPRANIIGTAVLGRPPERQEQQRSETQSPRLSFDALGNLITPANAMEMRRGRPELEEPGIAEAEKLAGTGLVARGGSSAVQYPREQWTGFYHPSMPREEKVQRARLGPMWEQGKKFGLSDERLMKMSPQEIYEYIRNQTLRPEEYTAQ